jgi:uncharacterized membrane protein YhaH (DUF805 family)
MSKPVFSDLFTFSGRRNRKSYVLFYLASVALILGGMLLATLVTVASPTVGGILWVIYIAVMLALVVSSFAVSAQRIRDCGYSGCWVFVYFIPYVGFAASLALFFIPSNVGENRFGPSCI